jgi:superfamily II DNA or RNA helicase
MIELLHFQKQAVANIHAMLAANATRVLLQSATASGKTVIGAQFLKEYLEINPNHNVLVLLNLQVLIGQTYDTLVNHFGLKPAVLHDEIIRNTDGIVFPRRGFNSNVLITMPVTLVNTSAGKNRLEYDPTWIPNLILIDEAHKATSLNFQIIRDSYPDAIVLGLTATPYREKNEEGEHLTEWYGDNLITTISIPELIELGRLVQPIYFEFDEDTHAVNKWEELTTNSTNKKTILFTRDTRHSLMMLEAFLTAGINARIVTSGSEDIIDDKNLINVPHLMELTKGAPLLVNRIENRINVTTQTPAQRQEIFRSFEQDVDVLISVNALCEGFDSPIAKFCFLCRTVGNHALLHQMIGRTLRAHPTKSEAIVADFYGNIGTHGHIEDYEWNLNAPTPDTKHLSTQRTITLNDMRKRSSITIRCTECNHVYDIKKSRTCSHCETLNEITMTGDVSDWTEPFPNLKLPKQFADFSESARKLRGVRYDEPGYRNYMAQLNRKAGVEVYDMNSGAPNPRYRYLLNIAYKKLTKKDKFSMII